MVKWLDKLVKEWGDEAMLVLSSVGVFAVLSLLIMAFAGPDAAPYNLTEIQRIGLTYLKFASLNVFAWINTWLIANKFNSKTETPSFSRTWDFLGVYFASLALLVWLHYS